MPADAKKLLDLFEQEAKPRRSSFEFHWQEVADLVLPTRDFTVTKRQPGTQRRNRIFDETAPNAAVSLASAMHGLLFNPLIRWFAVGTEEQDDQHDDESSFWLYDTTSRMLAWFAHPSSGSAVSSYEVMLDVIVFGTGIELVRERPDRLTFQARQLSNFYMIANDEGTITDQFRDYEMTPRDMMAVFSKPGDTLDDKIKKQAEDATSEHQEKRSILHAVYERNDRDPMRRNGPNKPWASIYIDKEAKKVIRESGFDENPYMSPRWSKAPEEVYGRGPAMQMLPAIKGVNAIARTILQAGELAINPPIISFDNLREGNLRTTPGARIYLRGGSRDVPQPLLSGADPRLGDAMLVRQQDKIEQAFFLDRFTLPSADADRGQPRMTATEIIERRQEGLLMASPVLSRLYAEWLNHRIRRVFSWMVKTGQLLPMPEALRGRALKPHYISPMALSQKASQTQSFLAAFNTALPLMNADPSVIQNLDPDETFRGIYQMFNAPPQFLRSREAVRQLRDQQRQAEQVAQQLEAAQTAASTARDAAAGFKDIAGAAA